MSRRLFVLTSAAATAVAGFLPTVIATVSFM